MSFDSRYEIVYSAAVVADNFNFERGTGNWRRVLQEYPTEMVLMPTAYPAAQLMAREPGWTVVYRDAVSVLYLAETRSRREWQIPEPAPGTLL